MFYLHFDGMDATGCVTIFIGYSDSSDSVEKELEKMMYFQPSGYIVYKSSVNLYSIITCPLYVKIKNKQTLFLCLVVEDINFLMLSYMILVAVYVALILLLIVFEL